MEPYELANRSAWVEIEFSNEFVTWMVLMNAGHDHTCDFYCMGWEL